MKFQTLSGTTSGDQAFIKTFFSALIQLHSSNVLKRIRATAIVAFAIACCFSLAAQAATFTVTSANDVGAGTLRQAILDANANPGADVIDFNIQGSGVHTIFVKSNLPTVTDPLTIDGYTQPGSSANTLTNGDNAVLLIELAGSGALSLADIGLEITAGSSTVRGLVINGFHNGNFGSGFGIKITAKGNDVITGNFIGTNPAGTVKIKNTTGILIDGSSFNTIGGAAPAERNVISGNGDGLYIYNSLGAGGPGSAQTMIFGNFIGTDHSGTVALGNEDLGISIGEILQGVQGGQIGGVIPGQGNVISGNGASGIYVPAEMLGLEIVGNLIGTDVTGKVALGNGEDGISINTNTDGSVTIGGSGTASRNVISGNKRHGIYLAAGDGTGIFGNYIGTDITGSAALGNGSDGILVWSKKAIIGAIVPGTTNVISANAVGIEIAQSATGTIVQKNLIGYAADGATPLGNKGHGVVITSGNNSVIGGQSKGNAIGFNGGHGVYVAAGIGNLISSNSITSNLDLGIELSPADVTINDPGDADSGPNQLQNYPVINSATTSGPVTTVTGSLNSTPNTQFRLELFANSACDPSGFGEGRTFIGALAATTDAAGNVNFSQSFGGLSATQFITATAIDPANNTSEFSQCSLVQSAPLPTVSINDVNQAEGNSGAAAFQFSVVLSAASGQTVTVNYATADATAQAGSDYQSANGTVTFAPGETSKTVSVLVSGDTQVEPNEIFFVNLSNPVSAALSKAQGTGTILNDDNVSAPTLQFNASNYSVQEDLGALTITVMRTGDTSVSAAVDYSTVDGTATQKGDYEYAAGTLKFAPGDTTKTFQVLLNEDTYIEGPETFTVTLSNPVGATLGATPTTTVGIIDDVPESFTNPIDDPSSFVYQHYHDFLNREPDPAGLAFWTSQITSCGADAQCVESRRNRVATAFFVSIEFQQTGYLIYLFQKESFGSLPKYSGFMRDLQEVSRGVVVGSQGWEQKLADNQQRFADQWVSRPEFKAAYAVTSNAEFVSALYANAGVVPPQAKRDSLVSALDASTESRAAVLLDVATDAAFRQQQQNSAFVLMQYFGYLRRDPDAAPDADLSGYNFWVNKLNQFNGDFVNAEMVTAFIVSPEYRQRFGL